MSISECTKLVREHREHPIWLLEEQTVQYHLQQILTMYLACLIRRDMITTSARIAQLWEELAKY